ncbi:MAG: InlB B-repeat-containing protein [Acetivibrio sp.]
MENAQKVLALPTQGNEVYFEAYQYLKAAYDAVLSNAQDRNYSYVTNPELVSSFGWEGDKDAPISYIDGSYHLRDREGRMINFGVWEIPGKIAWYNKEGYLPCFVSEFEKNQLKHSIENFADMVEVEGKKFEIAYSRMTTTNTSKTVMNLPKVSAGLIPLNEAAAVQKEVAPGETVIREYAIGADRFGGTYAYPTDEKIKALGSWDTHYEHMKQYWNTRLNGVIDIKALPTGYEELINAYKAGYIYTLLIADDYKLHVGENGYDRVFDHDAMGIIATLVTMGDFRNFDAYANHAMDNIQYPDAFWKYSWPYAVYLVKTGETDYIAGKFDKIKDATHRIETERVKFGTVKDVDGNDARIMKQTKAVDSLGYWLIDNWSGLTGLTTYRYICDTLYEKTKTESYKTESQWALSEYDSLLKSTEAVLKSTMKEYSFDYLPMAMDVPNELSVRKDPRDANWAAHFLFGRWSWDGYLFGADQNSFMLDMIDQTYTYGIERRKKEGVSDSMYNFGGYPHGYYCSAYNAGYGSAGLKGEQYRDMGIEAYKFMIENAMSGPFGWWEGVDYQDANSPWDRTHAKGGGGSCQHMWGQSTATKVLIDALITEKADGNIIVGRGIPKSWITEGEKVEFSNYPIENKKRMGYQLTTKGKNVVLELSGDAPTKAISFELMSFVNNIASAEGLSFDNAKGSVNIPAGTKKVTVTLKEAPKKYTVSFDTKGGSSVPEQMVAAGEKVQKPSDPTKNGYEFIGWYQGNTKYDFDAPVKEALTLTAKWEEVVIPTPDYPNNGGNTMKEETVLEDLKDKVAEELKKEEGKRSEIKIDLKGKTELPKSVLEEIKGKDIVISIQLGEGMKWILNGKDMIGKDLKTIDLSVKEDSGNIPKEEMEQLLGKNSGTQISMENKENFGFKATLELSMDKENGKAIANVYSYNKKTKEFTLQTTGKVDENGKVKLTFTRTSDYVIMLDDKVAITEDILEKSKNNVSKKTLYTQKDKGNTKRIKVTLPRVVREAISNELLSKEKITYTSSNKKIAVVSSKGNVRAVKPGKVTIYAHIKIDGVKTVLKTKVQVKK